MQHHFSVGLAGMTFEHTRPGSGMGLCFSFHKGCSWNWALLKNFHTIQVLVLGL
jgi:hypothetical protein